MKDEAPRIQAQDLIDHFTVGGRCAASNSYILHSSFITKRKDDL